MWTVHTPQTSIILFAQNGHLQWDFLLAAGGLIGVVGLGIWAIYLLKRWRDDTAQEAPLSPQEQLDYYQKMADDGLLDPQEFARIKELMEHGPPATPPRPRRPPDTSIREM